MPRTIRTEIQKRFSDIDSFRHVNNVSQQMYFDVGKILIGLGCAPVYPCIIHETPVNFGRELSMSMTGLQMAFAYVGSCLAPPLFGLLAQNVTPRLYPWYLAVGLVVMVIMSESLHAKKAAEHR